MSRKFGYARVNSDGQDLTAQREALRAAGCDIIRDEKVSGGSTVGREQLAILLDFIAVALRPEGRLRPAPNSKPAEHAAGGVNEVPM